MDTFTSLSLDDIYRLVTARKAILIDVREEDEWKEGHIEGAIHIPLSKIEEDIHSSFPKHLPHDLLLIYCARGRRARYAVETLGWGKGRAASPIKEIFSLPYGFSDLAEFGFPTVSTV